ncbi:MAG: 50S ribosomal protein L2 [Candidatus Hodgkinia cicadicola]
MDESCKLIRPTSPGTRSLVLPRRDHLFKGEPVKQLVACVCERAGRNNMGRITVRHRGGRVKRAYRIVDFRRRSEVGARVVRIEYDPNRTAWIALLRSEFEELRYVLAVEGLRIGDWVESLNRSHEVEPKLGSTVHLNDLPVGTRVCNIELRAGEGGTVARAAGSWCLVRAKTMQGVVLKLSSGCCRLFDGQCVATVGEVAGKSGRFRKLGKAGRSRWMGRRPSVRGVAMNPVDHPHGGGEGKTSGGRHPVSPWGQLAKGKKTRCRREKAKLVIVPEKR